MVRARWRRLKSLALSPHSDAEKKSVSSSQTKEKTTETVGTKVNIANKVINENYHIYSSDGNKTMDEDSKKALSKNDRNTKEKDLENGTENSDTTREPRDQKKINKIQEKDNISKKKQFRKSTTSTEPISQEGGHLNPDFQKETPIIDDGGIWMGDIGVEIQSSSLPSCPLPSLFQVSVSTPKLADPSLPESCTVDTSKPNASFADASVESPTSSQSDYPATFTTHTDSSTISKHCNSRTHTKESEKSAFPQPSSCNKLIGPCPPPLSSSRAVKSVSFEICSEAEEIYMKFNKFVDDAFSIIEIEEDTG